MIGAEVTLLTALLYYFGLTRNQAEAEYLGFFRSHLSASVQREMLGSVPALITPLLLLTTATLVWQLSSAAVERFLAARPRLCLSLTTAIVVLPLSAWAITRLLPQWWELGLPLSLATGAIISCYAGRLWTRTRPPSEDPDTHQFSWTASASMAAAGVVVVLMFWTMGVLASIQGRSAAQDFVAGLADQPSVTVFSEEDLQLNAAGVRVAHFGSGRYRFRYQGLKPYTYSSGNLFLLAPTWRYDNPRVFVLKEQDGMRIEYGWP
ncbi:hypothetical protein IPZ61_01545 [Streptomyces sioyaensis]|uniref:hypothetical protein n=1 Tax=Streptomyces sioyaensis TaxID=67364 RepID=UPI001F3560B7|nr:hypothetical protein [Streptomyces sioyaensis]MCF3172025.1 hypothetical protein [Streptomyces sioyaensis]